MWYVIWLMIRTNDSFKTYHTSLHSVATNSGNPIPTIAKRFRKRVGINTTNDFMGWHILRVIETARKWARLGDRQLWFSIHLSTRWQAAVIVRTHWHTVTGSCDCPYTLTHGDRQLWLSVHTDTRWQAAVIVHTPWHTVTGSCDCPYTLTHGGRQLWLSVHPVRR